MKVRGRTPPTAGGAQLAGPGDPHRDRQSVTDRTDGDGGQPAPWERPSIVTPTARFTEPATTPLMKVMLAGDQRRGGGDGVVDAPAHACSCDEECAGVHAARGRRRERRRRSDRADAERRPATDLLVEEHPRDKTVATSSRFNSSDTVEAGVRSSASTSNTGATPPPRATAVISRMRCERWTRRARPRLTNGATPMAAPRYSSPASDIAPMSSTRNFVAAVDVPNSTAAAAHHHHPWRCVIAWLVTDRSTRAVIDSSSGSAPLGNARSGFTQAFTVAVGAAKRSQPTANHAFGSIAGERLEQFGGDAEIVQRAQRLLRGFERSYVALDLLAVVERCRQFGDERSRLSSLRTSC